MDYLLLAPPGKLHRCYMPLCKTKLHSLPFSHLGDLSLNEQKLCMFLFDVGREKVW